jgi:uncharacterized membrane protein
MVIKLDLRKAYGKFSWLFVRLILIHTVFGLYFINWVEGCFNSSSFYVLVNGFDTKIFKPIRAPIQGHTLFPLMVFSISKGLSRIIEAYKRNKKLKEVKLGRNISFTCFFVDGVLLFGDSSIRVLVYIK